MIYIYKRYIYVIAVDIYHSGKVSVLSNIEIQCLRLRNIIYQLVSPDITLIRCRATKNSHIFTIASPHGGCTNGGEKHLQQI